MTCMPSGLLKRNKIFESLLLCTFVLFWGGLPPDRIALSSTKLLTLIRKSHMCYEPHEICKLYTSRVHIKHTMNCLLLKYSLNPLVPLSWSMSFCGFSTLRFSFVHSSVMAVAASLPAVVLDSGSALTTAFIIMGISSVVSGQVLGHFFCCVLLISSACLFLVECLKTAFGSLVFVAQFFCGRIFSFFAVVAFSPRGIVFFCWVAFFVCLGITMAQRQTV